MIFSNPFQSIGFPSHSAILQLPLCEVSLYIYIKFIYSKLYILRWLPEAYTQDILTRLPQLLATAMFIYGHILKIDSTKVVKKLQGAAARTATWVTNVGNEQGEILISVVTESEGLLSLQPMANGLMKQL